MGTISCDCSMLCFIKLRLVNISFIRSYHQVLKFMKWNRKCFYTKGDCWLSGGWWLGQKSKVTTVFWGSRTGLKESTMSVKSWNMESILMCDGKRCKSVKEKRVEKREVEVRKNKRWHRQKRAKSKNWDRNSFWRCFIFVCRQKQPRAREESEGEGGERKVKRHDDQVRQQ